MYKILIAEDSALIRRGIIAMVDWNRHNCILAGEAENGKIAIKLLETLQPDILFLDVKMPLLDGLKVLDYIQENHINVQIIMISGYSSFDYIKHALHANAIDYILKPIHEEELNQALTKAINTLSQTASESISLMPDNHIGTKLEENIYSTFADVFYPESDQTFFWVVSIKNKYNDYTFFKEQIQIQLPKSVHVIFHEHLNRLDIIFYSDLFKHFEDVAKILHHIYLLSDALLKNLLYIGISEIHAADYIITKAYYEAHKALCSKILHPNCPIIFFSQSKQKMYNLDDVFSGEIPLLDFLTSGNQIGAIELCQNIIRHHLDNPEIKIDEFCMLLTELYCIFAKTGSNCVNQIQQEISTLHNLDSLLNYDSVQPLIDTCYNYCTTIATDMINRRTDIDSTILEIQKYIEQHFSEQISLKTLENLFHLNGSYISVMFKRITGTGINKYIRQLRLDHAINLISTTDFKLSEICEKCGYTNYVHFSKEFKKYTGFSPIDYRQKKHECY